MRDPIINPAASPSGSPKDTSSGRIKKVDGGSPNYSGDNATTKRSPPPNSPYGKR